MCTKKNKMMQKTLALLLFISCGFLNALESGFNPELQDNFTIIVSSHNYDLNPHTASYSAEAQLLTGLYEGLFTYDPITLDPVPAIAKSYRLSRDKKRWTFILRDDVKFSNGSPVTSEDVIRSWLMLLSNKNASFSSLFDIVEGAADFRNGKSSPESVGLTAVDEHTVSVHLVSPASYLPKLLCMAAFSIVDAEQAAFSGPFVISQVLPDRLILSKNENYYDKEKVPLNQITVILSSDDEENTFAYNTGSADWLSASFKNDSLLIKDSVQLCAEFATQYFFFRIRDNIWKNKELRAAILEAVPWEQIRENSYVQATTLVYPLAGYPVPQGYLYTDKNEAELLLSDAKKSLGINKDERLAIKFAVPDAEYMIKKAELLQSAWKEIGVDLEIIKVPDIEYLSSIETIDADLFTYTWIGDFADPLAFLELFRGGSTMNVSNWANPEYDSLLDQSALYTDSTHSELLSKAEQILLDEAVIMPVQHPVSVNVINLNAVGGWALNAFDIHPLKYLFKRETKTQVPDIAMLTHTH